MTKPAWRPLVRLDTRAKPSFTVLLSDEAYRSMGDQAYAQRGQVETGGGLFGVPAGERDNTVTVRRVGGPGRKARASRTSLRVDREALRREAIDLHRSDSPTRWIGFWHTHPSVGAGEPSDADLRCFAWDCRELFHYAGRTPPHYLALILSPNWEQERHSLEAYPSWAKPTVHAWHMRALSDDQFVVTRAEVTR